MNEEKLEILHKVYRSGLYASVCKNPEKYYYMQGSKAEEYADIVSGRMIAYIRQGRHNCICYTTTGWKNACKALGIKHTRKAILEYLEIVP